MNTYDRELLQYINLLAELSKHTAPEIIEAAESVALLVKSMEFGKWGFEGIPNFKASYTEMMWCAGSALVADVPALKGRKPRDAIKMYVALAKALM